ncbi:MAG: magnesium/cobalt transporter CorA [Desulfuromonadia bacterium]
MIRAFMKIDGLYRPVSIDPEEIEGIDQGSLLWLDLNSPTPDILQRIESYLKLELPTRQESEEIEYSSRYWEDDAGIMINTSFIARHDEGIALETVSFILKDHFIVTIRFTEIRTFTDFSRRLRLNSSAFRDGVDVLSGILGLRVDMDADILENLSKEIVVLGRKGPGSFEDPEQFLQQITRFEDTNITIRDNLTDKQRILSSLLKSPRLTDRHQKEFSMMIKDVNSLTMSANFNFDRLDYLQNIFLNHLSIEQNKVIKIFTVMSVIFMPPTLIASIYGMNFKYLPELELPYGYPMALCLIIVSAVLPIWIFKKKGWL